MKFLKALLLLAFLQLLSACSGSGEATTRKEQEAEFKLAFGFPAPASIVEINYADLSNRGVVDSAYAQWFKFTYDAKVFERIVATGFTPATFIFQADSDAAPPWWASVMPANTTEYSRTHEDTPSVEGFSFREKLWHDESTGHVYFHKSYWD